VLCSFGDCLLDVDRRELKRGAELIPIEPQVFDVLVYLVQNRDRVVSKDDLLAAVWRGRSVSESTLTSRINSARAAIGDTGGDQRLIRTIARKGVRFVGEVREVTKPDGAAAEGPPAVEAETIPPAPQLPDKPSIAVLPFTNMSGDPEQEYFSDGITEDIITALSRLRWFFVIARNSTFVYKNQAVNVKQVGRDLGVRYLLEGSVRKSGQRVRITSQLMDAGTGNHIWAERYDRELTDIFALQDEITASVTAAIEPRLVAAEGLRVETRTIDDLDAWDLVARAMSHFWKLNAMESGAAIGILRLAVQRHPNYGPAHSMLAFTLLVSMGVGWILDQGERNYAGRMARRAVELDDTDPWAHMALGYLGVVSRNTSEAVEHFQTALELNPNFAAAHGYVGWAQVYDGHTEEALSHFEQAMRMSPRDPLNGFFFAGISAGHYLAGRYPEAVQFARQAVKLRPGILGGHRILCASLAQAGQIEEAKLAMARLRQLHPEVSAAWIEQSVPYTAEPMRKFLEGLHMAGLND
jgi:TolB-like protein/Tfp pilus assembly protein PilF